MKMKLVERVDAERGACERAIRGGRCLDGFCPVPQRRCSAREDPFGIKPIPKPPKIDARTRKVIRMVRQKMGIPTKCSSSVRSRR